MRAGLVASPRTRRDAHRVPLIDRDDLVVDLYAPAPTDYHVHLLLCPVRMAVGKPIASRDTLIGQTAALEFERFGRRTELQVRCAIEHRPDLLQILLEVPERERHGAQEVLV